jgi:predicted regulator of Ras-like GTPase activity (Roadblock/LC7/MglB family)
MFNHKSNCEVSYEVSGFSSEKSKKGIRIMDLILEKKDLDKIRDCLESMLKNASAESVLCVDRSGRLIWGCGNRSEEELVPLAALTAANFGATEAIANIIGEKDFTLLFHKGKEENIHFSAIGKDFILITIFNNKTSLGLIRLEVERATQELLQVFA